MWVKQACILLKFVLTSEVKKREKKAQSIPPENSMRAQLWRWFQLLRKSQSGTWDAQWMCPRDGCAWKTLFSFRKPCHQQAIKETKSRKQGRGSRHIEDQQVSSVFASPWIGHTHPFIAHNFHLNGNKYYLCWNSLPANGINRKVAHRKLNNPGPKHLVISKVTWSWVAQSEIKSHPGLCALSKQKWLKGNNNER